MANLWIRMVAAIATAALALAAQIPFFRLADGPVPASVIAANGVAILLYCIAAVLIAGRSLAA